MNNNCKSRNTHPRTRSYTYQPAANIRKSETEVNLDLALPGWSRDEITLKVEDRNLDDQRSGLKISRGRFQIYKKDVCEAQLPEKLHPWKQVGYRQHQRQDGERCPFSDHPCFGQGNHQDQHSIITIKSSNHERYKEISQTKYVPIV